MKAIAKLIATGFYSGYFPFASGTIGSLVGLLIYYPMTKLPNNTSYLLLTVVIFFIGIWAATEAEKIYNQKDSGKIVIDEIVGMLVTLFALPVTPLFIIMGFFIFRIADVAKPGIRWAEKIPGGLGVMLDDLLAGILCNLLLQLIKFLMK
jgi:phosphatidylglycerophosphatase A